MILEDKIDDSELNHSLEEIITRIERASESNLNLYHLLEKYLRDHKKFIFTMKRSGEDSSEKNLEEIKKKYRIVSTD